MHGSHSLDEPSLCGAVEYVGVADPAFSIMFFTNHQNGECGSKIGVP